MDKFQCYGIKGKFKTLINSYLTGRYQRVTLANRSYSGSKSKWEIIKCGVPQDSVLGPLFFLFYINGLPKIQTKNNNIVLYVDDTSIIITDKNKLKFKINRNQMFKQINMWFNTNLLTLNLKKTQYLEFRTRNSCNSPTRIHCDQGDITTTTMTIFLGLIIDNTLSWKQQIEQFVDIILMACYALRNIKCTVSLKTLRLAYFAHVHSIMTCGIMFWGSSARAHKVSTMQKKLLYL
jgi:hypothetical protein